jgi:flagellar basal-body rod protein FlgB
MSSIGKTLFNHSDAIQRQALNHRQARAEVIGANIANHETPGYLAIEYSFEQALQSAAGGEENLAMKTSSPRHYLHPDMNPNDPAQGTVYVQPTESISEDGNSVDIDNEMAQMSQNNILYRAVVETINRKLAVLRYAISGGQ